MFNEDMAKGQALTIPNIISAMKEAGFTTKSDLEELRKKINDDQFEARTEFFTNMTLPAIEKSALELKEELVTQIEGSEYNLSKEIDDLKVEFASSPLKSRLPLSS